MKETWRKLFSFRIIVFMLCTTVTPVPPSLCPNFYFIFLHLISSTAVHWCDSFHSLATCMGGGIGIQCLGVERVACLFNSPFPVLENGVFGYGIDSGFHRLEPPPRLRKGRWRGILVNFFGFISYALTRYMRFNHNLSLSSLDPFLLITIIFLFLLGTFFNP